MTIDLDFYLEGEILLTINLCRVNFANKVCGNIPNEELDEDCIYDEETEDEIYVNKAMVKRIWDNCFRCGYIQQPYNVWPDTLVVHY
jgi:hypothetical protein